MAEKKDYVRYYQRVLGMKPNMALVQKAVKGEYTMGEFRLLIQREDTNNFLRSAEGQRVASDFRDLWATIFPSLGRQPGIKALRKFLQEKPSKGYRDITAPSSRRDMYAFLSGTKLFKKIYPEFKETKFLRTLDFAGYRTYKDEFKRVMRAYGQDIGDKDIGYFFASDITPEDFEKNLATVLAGSGAYKWGTGQAMTQQQARAATYGRAGSVATLSKISQELEKQQRFMQSEQAKFGVRRNDVGRIEQATAY